MTKVYKLKSSDSIDGEIVEVDEAIFMEMRSINKVVSEEADDIIPIPNVTLNNLKKVVAYCEKHVHFKFGPLPEDLKAWDAELVNLDEKALSELLMASDYLGVMGLFDLVCTTIAHLTKGKNAQQLRAMFVPQ